MSVDGSFIRTAQQLAGDLKVITDSQPPKNLTYEAFRQAAEILQAERVCGYNTLYGASEATADADLEDLSNLWLDWINTFTMLPSPHWSGHERNDTVEVIYLAANQA
jgi:hypothetical protein